MREVSATEAWIILHGMGLGALFLLAFAGGLAGLWSLRPGFLTEAGISDRLVRLRWGTGLMAAIAWATCVTGTYVAYPWFRELVEAGQPGWRDFGMDWKEHVAWFSPILATTVAFIVWRHGSHLVANRFLRYATLILFLVAFGAAGVAGALGAFVTKAMPIM